VQPLSTSSSTAPQTNAQETKYMMMIVIRFLGSTVGGTFVPSTPFYYLSNKGFT